MTMKTQISNIVSNSIDIADKNTVREKDKWNCTINTPYKVKRETWDAVCVENGEILQIEIMGKIINLQAFYNYGRFVCYKCEVDEALLQPFLELAGAKFKPLKGGKRFCQIMICRDCEVYISSYILTNKSNLEFSFMIDTAFVKII